MSIMARTPDQVFMSMMQRGCPLVSSSCPVDSGSDLASHVLEVPRAGVGSGGVGPGFGRYWARSSWSSCAMDSSHVGVAGHSPQQQQQHQHQQHLAPAPQMGIPPFSSSSSPPSEFPSFGSAGKLYNPQGHVGVVGGGGMGPFSLGVSSSSSLCEPTRGHGASFATVQQPLLEAVEGITEASTMAEPAAAASSAAATIHGHVEVTITSLAAAATQQENTNNSSSEHHSPARSPSHDNHHHAGSGKRKKDGLATPDPKGGEAKRCKGDRARQGSGSEVSTDSGSPKAVVECKGKAKEYSKQDYIHVRARRGQATDSHSLAERVRREKINERMKFLQDLVPGCKKVTGKAVMLDEIIKYVQSLQRLVEVQHLTMNLASVSPAQPDLTLENLVSNKEMLQSSHSSSSILGSSNGEAGPGALDLVQMGLSHQAGRRLVMGGGGSCGFDFQLPLANAGSDLRHHMSLPVASLTAAHTTMMQQQQQQQQHQHRSLDNSNNVSQSLGWDGELQSVVQMGLSHQGRLGAFEGFHCQLPVAHMKVEF